MRLLLALLVLAQAALVAHGLQARLSQPSIRSKSGSGSGVNRISTGSRGSGVNRISTGSRGSSSALWVQPQPFAPNANPFTRVEAPEIPLSSDVSQLPESFLDAVKRASRCTIECVGSGTRTCRIDFDTSVADMTYTSLKNTTPFIKEFVKELSADMGIGSSGGTIRVFFPDMGAAALVRRDWKMGTEASEVPDCLQTANIQNDPLAPTDRVAILLCPLYSESDFVKRIVDLCANASIPCLLVNPELINMDQGFGVRARNMRANLLSQFVTVYKLRTMKQGALVREWPQGYTVWNEDANQPDGYTLLQCFSKEPTREMVNDLFDAANPEDPAAKARAEGPSPAVAIINEISGFFKGMSRL